MAISDAEIVAAMQLLFERMKLVVEPSGAAGLAAVLSKDFAAELAKARAHTAARAAGSDTAAAAAAAGSQLAGDGSHDQQQQQLNVGVILCGGNLDFKDFWKLDNWQPAH